MVSPMAYLQLRRVVQYYIGGNLIMSVLGKELFMGCSQVKMVSRVHGRQRTT